MFLYAFFYSLYIRIFCLFHFHNQGCIVFESIFLRIFHAECIHSPVSCFG